MTEKETKGRKHDGVALTVDEGSNAKNGTDDEIEEEEKQQPTKKQSSRADETPSDPRATVGKAAAAGGAVGAASAVPVVTGAVSALGFTSSGIAAGSAAAGMMSAEAIAAGGGVAAGGTVATLQSIGAAGLGFVATLGVVATGGILVGAAAAGGAALYVKSQDQKKLNELRKEGRQVYVGCGVVGDKASFVHGNVVALHSPDHQRFLRVAKGNVVDGKGGKKRIDKLQSYWNLERFEVVVKEDFKEDEVALYNSAHRRFLRLIDGRVDASGGAMDMNKLASGCEYERFTVMDAGGGKVSLYSKRFNRFLCMDPQGNVDARTLSNDDELSWDEFSVRLLHVPGRLIPGRVVALHSPVHNRFLRMRGDTVDGLGGIKCLDGLPPNWDSERFTVVNAGNNEIALYSASHCRFVRISGQNVNGKGGVIPINKLPPRDKWCSERFVVIRSEKENLIALHSSCHKTQLCMTPKGAVKAKGGRAVDDIPTKGAWEAFAVFDIGW